MENIRKGLGKRIRTLRKLKALTQEELAERDGSRPSSHQKSPSAFEQSIFKGIICP